MARTRRELESEIADAESAMAELQRRLAGLRAQQNAVVPDDGVPPRTWGGLRDRMFDVADRILYHGTLDYRAGCVVVRALEDALWAASMESAGNRLLNDGE